MLTKTINISTMQANNRDNDLVLNGIHKGLTFLTVFENHFNYVNKINKRKNLNQNLKDLVEYVYTKRHESKPEE